MRLEECGFNEEEVEKIRYLARLFKCAKMTIEDIKTVDK